MVESATTHQPPRLDLKLLTDIIFCRNVSTDGVRQRPVKSRRVQTADNWEKLVDYGLAGLERAGLVSRHSFSIRSSAATRSFCTIQGIDLTSWERSSIRLAIAKWLDASGRLLREIAHHGSAAIINGGAQAGCDCADILKGLADPNDHDQRR